MYYTSAIPRFFKNMILHISSSTHFINHFST